jgi:acetylornithine deacetylase
LADDVVTLLAGLVAHPTIAGESNRALIDELADRFETLGARVSIPPGTRPGAHNLHAVLGPAGLAGGLLLAAHCDVVAVAGQPWTTDPFVLTEREGRLIGRGAVDMKGFIACVLAALPTAERLRRPLHVAISSDEELGCVGVPPLLDALAALPVPPAGAIVGEPTRLRVATAHKGKAAVRAVLRGRAAHSSVAPDGVNAVAYAGRLIVGLLALQDEIAAGEHDAAFAVPHSTIGIGPIAGGVRVNIVPDACTLELEARTLPGREPADVIAQIAALAAGLEREMRETAPEAGIALEPRAAYPGLAATDDGFAARVAALACDGGAPISLDFGTEAGLYQQRLGIPVVVCGPGDMAQAHRADESIGIDELRAGQAFVERLLGDLGTA